MINSNFRSVIFIIFFSLSICSSQLFAQWESKGGGIDETPRDYFSISAISEDIIWAIPINPNYTPSNEFTKTSDGGNSWHSSSIPNVPSDYYPLNIHALDENTAWVLFVNLPEQDRTKIFKTSDAGLTWTEQEGTFNDPGHAFATLHFFNENEGLGFGSPGTGNAAIDSLQIFRTSNGGDTWSRIEYSALPPLMSGEGVWVYSGNGSYDVKGDILWFVTRANRIFKTSNKGQSWEAYQTGMTNPFGGASIAFSDDLNGIVTAVTPQQAARTSDGGETWTSISIPNNPAAAIIQHIPGTNNSFVIGDGSFGSSTNMLISNDGADTWTTVTHSPSMSSFQFLSPQIGWGGTSIIDNEEGGLYKWVGSWTAVGDWKQLPSFPNPRERAFSFILNDKMYVGGGRIYRSWNDFSLCESDVWVFDFQTEIWEEVAPIPGTPFRNANGFTINGYGYVINGYDGSSAIDAFYRYDPNTNTWESLDYIPGEPRTFASEFVLNDKVYIACGAGSSYLNELWEYDPSTEIWTQKADFPGAVRWRAFSFAKDGKGFVGGGDNQNTTSYQDFYQYDPDTNEWIQMADFPSPYSGGGFDFIIEDMAYVGEGSIQFSQYNPKGTLVWQYDTNLDIWSEKDYFEGDVRGRELSFSESYNGKGYVGGGRIYYNFLPSAFMDDFWEFAPEAEPLNAVYESWETIGTGFDLEKAHSIWGLSIVDTNIVWGVATDHFETTQPIQSYFKTTDGGQTFQRGTFGEPEELYSPWSICAVNDQIAFIPADNQSNNLQFNLFKTSDGGNSWYAVEGNFANSFSKTLVAIHFFDINEGVAFGGDFSSTVEGIIYTTDDGGDTWEEVTELPEIQPYEVLDANSGNGNFEVIEDTIWYGNIGGGRIWKSIDRGHSWTTSDTGFPNVEWAGTAFKDGQNGMIVGNSVFMEEYENYAMVTTDGGETWTSIDIPQQPIAYTLEYVPGTDGTFIYHDGFMASTKMWITEDFGTTWQLWDRQPNLDCLQFFDGRHAWAGGQFNNAETKGLFKWTGNLGGMLTSTTEDLKKPSPFKSLKIYPNPGHSIVYVENPNNLNIQKFILYNSLGQIVNSSFTNGINLMHKFDISDLPKGIYYLTALGPYSTWLQSTKLIKN